MPPPASIRGKTLLRSALTIIVIGQQLQPAGGLSYNPICQNITCALLKRPVVTRATDVDDSVCINVPADASATPTYVMNPKCPVCLLDWATTQRTTNANASALYNLLASLNSFDAPAIRSDQYHDILNGNKPSEWWKQSLPMLNHDNWLTSQIITSIASILLREVMGFGPPKLDNATLAALGVASVPTPILQTHSSSYMETDLLCCPQTIMEFEEWPGRYLSAVTYPTVDRNQVIRSATVGYEGVSNLFVSGFMTEQYPLITTYQSLLVLPAYLNAFPAAFSTDCKELLVDPAKGCVEGNYVCDGNPWTVAKCERGRFVPPQCQGTDPGSGLPRISFCREALLADPTWDIGYFEGLIVLNKLNFTVAYLGVNNLLTYVLAQTKLKVPQLFYWYEPDPFIAQVNGVAVQFKQYNLDCAKAKKKDPLLTGCDCGYPSAALVKTVRRADFAPVAVSASSSDTDPWGDMRRFYDGFQITGAELRSLIGQHVSGGGTQNVYSIACDWVKTNPSIWQEWTRNTLPASTAAQRAAAAAREMLAAQERQTATTVGAAVGSIGGSLVALLLLIVLVMRYRAAKINQHAPRESPLTLIFTDIQSSSKLWERFPREMAAAVETHHAVIRKQIEEFNAYEVKTIGDSFMIAMKATDESGQPSEDRVLEAVLLAVAIQRELMDAPWPRVMRSPYEAIGDNVGRVEVVVGRSVKTTSLSYSQLSGPVVDTEPFCGLRVRVGVHYCTEAAAKFDLVAQRYDYYGHDVNVSARVESVAHGGQILIDEATKEMLEGSMEALEAECVVQKYANGLELKGIANRVSLYSVVPKELSKRVFPPPENDLAGSHAQLLTLGGSTRDSAGPGSASVASQATPQKHRLLSLAKHIVQVTMGRIADRTSKESWLNAMLTYYSHQPSSADRLSSVSETVRQRKGSVSGLHQQSTATRTRMVSSFLADDIALRFPQGQGAADVASSSMIQGASVSMRDTL